jgi:hypothetical protein
VRSGPVEQDIPMLVSAHDLGCATLNLVYQDQLCEGRPEQMPVGAMQPLAGQGFTAGVGLL